MSTILMFEESPQLAAGSFNVAGAITVIEASRPITTARISEAIQYRILDRRMGL